MNYSEMVRSIHLGTRIPMTKVDAVLRTFFREVEQTAMSGEPVTLRSFGKFTRKDTKPRKLFGKTVKGRGTLKFSQRRRRGQARRSD